MPESMRQVAAKLAATMPDKSCMSGVMESMAGTIFTNFAMLKSVSLSPNPNRMSRVLGAV